MPLSRSSSLAVAPTPVAALGGVRVSVGAPAPAPPPAPEAAVGTEEEEADDDEEEEADEEEVVVVVAAAAAAAAEAEEDAEAEEAPEASKASASTHSARVLLAVPTSEFRVASTPSTMSLCSGGPRLARTTRTGGPKPGAVARGVADTGFGRFSSGRGMVRRRASLVNAAAGSKPRLPSFSTSFWTSSMRTASSRLCGRARRDTCVCLCGEKVRRWLNATANKRCSPGAAFESNHQHQHVVVLGTRLE